MRDASENQAYEDPPADRASWQRRVRWFGGEFIVVVAGVLAALALQAGYQATQDSKLERVYLDQLTSDLRTNAEILGEAIAGDEPRLAYVQSLIAALYQPRVPPADSLRLWLGPCGGCYADPRPVLGTISTLLQTGDIRLLRTGQVRTQIVAYSAMFERDMLELSRNVDRLIRSTAEINVQWEQNGIRPVAAFASEDSSGMTASYVANWPKIASDPELRAAYQDRKSGLSNRVFYMKRMLASTDSLLKAINDSRK